MSVEEIVNRNADKRAAMEKALRSAVEAAKVSSFAAKRRMRQRCIGSALLVASGVSLLVSIQAALEVNPIGSWFAFALFAVLSLFGCNLLDAANDWR